MIKTLAAVTLLFALIGCTATQVASVEAEQAKIEAAIATACTEANAAAALAAPFSAIPQVAGVLLYIQAGCAGANAVSALTTKALADPTTVAWAVNLKAQLQAVLPKT